MSFDYTAAFRTGAEGLFHAEVAGNWYAWTQMEPIDARRMFPGFDEPGFKTPFTVTVTAPQNLKVFANAPEANAAPAGAMIVHRFAPTAPLPTYLVAVGVGPFDVVESVPGFARPEAIGLLEGYCDSDSIQKVDAFVKPKLKELGGGELRLEQTKDRIEQCVALKQAKGAEIAAALGR